jgi:hypothetical protein
MSLDLHTEIIATSFLSLHAAVKELSLTQLASDSVALATAAVLLAGKTKEAHVKQTEIVDVAVKLASADKATISIELFAERKRILKDKAGFFETLIIRLIPLDVPLGFYYLAGICPHEDAKLLKVANKLLLDFYRSSLALEIHPETLANGALQLAKLALADQPTAAGKVALVELQELLEDVYT